MAAEIERRFFVDPNALSLPSEKDEITQGYLPPHDYRFNAEKNQLTLDGGASFQVTLTLTDQDAAQIADEDLSELISRLRLKNDTEALITLKGPKNDAGEGSEYEYSLPISQGKALLHCCGDQVLQKTRYKLPAIAEHKTCWEVDFFHGPLEGLVLAEIELQATGVKFEKPTYLRDEITGDHRYANVNMVKEVPPIPTIATQPKKSPNSKFHP